jgi:hypothetical protein
MAMFRDTTEPDSAPETRGKLTELEARAFHESDAHPDHFAMCKRGCWEAAEVEVERAIASGKLVPVEA